VELHRHPVQLWNIGGHISDSFAWNTMPWSVYLLTRSGHANDTTCGQPTQRMEFGGNADAPSSEDNSLANNLQAYARDGWTGYTLGLRAPNEQDVNQYKRFGDAALAVASRSPATVATRSGRIWTGSRTSSAA
jgi:hypothetical protein